MTANLYYRCEGCQSEFTVESDSEPTIICPECDIVATLCDDSGVIILYRVGYAQYREGRRQLSSAIASLEEERWVNARALCNSGADAFEEAVGKFTRVVDRGDDPSVSEPADSARKKATRYWRAADWLSGTAYAREKRAQDRAQTYQREAEQQIRRAGEFGDLIAPDTFLSESDPDSS